MSVAVSQAIMYGVKHNGNTAPKETPAMHTTTAPTKTDAQPVSRLANGLAHLPKVTYHRPTDSYRAACPDCDWTTEPSLNTAALHEAANAHYAAA